jgi:hypothetical protein
MDPGLIELFVDGKEDGLPDSGRLDGLGLGSGSVVFTRVFMLHRLGWRWDECGSKITKHTAKCAYTTHHRYGIGKAPYVTGTGICSR